MSMKMIVPMIDKHVGASVYGCCPNPADIYTHFKFFGHINSYLTTINETLMRRKTSGIAMFLCC